MNVRLIRVSPRFSLTPVLLLLCLLGAIIPPIAHAADGDGDGVMDSVDTCPFAQGTSSIGSQGCPDSDGDGISDFDTPQVNEFDLAPRFYWQLGGSGYGNSARKVTWAPDSSFFAGGGDDERVRLYSNGAQSLGTLATMDEDVRSLAISPNGSWIAIGTEGELEIREIPSGNLVKEITEHGNGVIYDLSWTSDGQYLYSASGYYENKVVRTNVSDWTTLSSWEEPSSYRALSISPDDRLVAYSYDSTKLVVKWAENGSIYFNKSDHTDDIMDVVFSPDGRWLVTCGDDNVARVYNTSTGQLKKVLTNSSRDVNAIAFSPDGAWMAMGTREGSGRMYDTSTWNHFGRWGDFGSGNSRGVRDVSWSPDGHRIAVARSSRYYHLYIQPDGYLNLVGDVTGGKLLPDWVLNWPSDGRLLNYDNQTTITTTMELCGDTDNIGMLTHGVSRHLVSTALDYSTTGHVTCDDSGEPLQELPIGRLPVEVFVKPSGVTQQCIHSLGGLTLAQLRWMFSGASDSDLLWGTGQPGMNLDSVVPNDDGDQIREWSDLSPSCPNLEVVTTGPGEWDEFTMMFEDLLLCGNCEVSENFGSSHYMAGMSDTIDNIVDTVNGAEGRIGFGSLKALGIRGDILRIPIGANLTHGIADHLNDGWGAVQATVDNSSTGVWPLQGDLELVYPTARTAEHLSLLEWSLNTTAQGILDYKGYIPLDLFALNHSYNLLGLDGSWLFTDTDGDGVWDGADRCPDTKEGESVDADGCSWEQRDDDHDGVPNPVDECVDTETGWEVNDVGCAAYQIDTDGDGIYDLDDMCANTTDFSTVDEQGCDATQRDTDEDGIVDALDACPNSPDPETANATGCDDTQRDDDGDGINRAYDSCPNTPEGMEVDVFGCSSTQRDTDSDGVNDAWDNCPNSANGDPVDYNGCSAAQLDSDQDDVSDADDMCPETQFGVQVNDKGCSASQRDTDYDGYNDDLDECPNTIPEDALKVDEHGCALSDFDTDEDGFNDAVDAFPNNPNQWLDTDSDGYGDNINQSDTDACPTVEGTSWRDRNGCPDSDGDGSSNPDMVWAIDRGADAFPGDSTQWSDTDGDGFGDNWGETSWNATRNASWPGEWVFGASAPDECPLEYSEYVIPKRGCPEDIDDSQDGGNSDGSGQAQGNQSDDEDFGILMLVAVAAGLVFLGLLAMLVIMLTRKPKKKAKTTITPEHSPLEGSSNHQPQTEWIGAIGQDGREWLEYPQDSGCWWIRDAVSGDWFAHQ